MPLVRFGDQNTRHCTASSHNKGWALISKDEADEKDWAEQKWLAQDSNPEIVKGKKKNKNRPKKAKGSTKEEHQTKLASANTEGSEGAQEEQENRGYGRQVRHQTQWQRAIERTGL